MKNLDEGRAEPQTVYPLLYEGERNAVERKRSVPLSSDRHCFVFFFVNPKMLINLRYSLYLIKVR